MGIFKLTIQKKLIFVIGILLVVTNLVVGLVSYNTAREEIEKSNKVIMINTVNMIKKIIELENSLVLSGNKTLETAQEDVKKYILGNKKLDGTRSINNNIILGEHGYVFILDKMGNEIAHPYIEGINVWDSKDMKTNDAYVAREIISKAYGGGGFTYFNWVYPYSKEVGEKITYSNIDPYWAWIIVASVYVEDINKGSLKIINVISNLLVFVFLYTSIAIILFSSHISEPIELITDAVEKVANGNLDIKPLNIKNKDETGKLNSSFELMIFNLKSEIEKRKLIQMKLENLNMDLENTVYERTKELEKNNEELLRANDDLNIAIRDLKLMQKQLIETEKIAALGNLVAGIAHEMNTPLGVAITTLTHLEKENKIIKEKFENEKIKKSELRNYFNLFDEASRILLYNINRAVELVLSFKRIAVDQNTEHKMKFDICEYLNTILLSLKHEYKRKDIMFSVKCDVKSEIFSVPGAFSHIFTNLIMNSILHGFKGRKNCKIDINIGKMNGKLFIVYEDNGKGIKKEILNKVFEPFFTTARGRGGSGLGLNIVYTVVTNQLGGNIKVESEDNKYTKFIMTIPVEFCEKSN